jgi:hypothetical protein
MSDHVFYSVEERRNERQLRILSVASLVSKPPTKEKRISIKVRMPLSGQNNIGAPEWLDRIYTFVAQNHDPVSPTIEFKGYQLTFSADNLFGTEVQCPNGAMRKFEVFEAGDEENPDVVCEFVLRIGFSSAAWDWLGQFVGDDAYVKFVPGEAGVAHPQEEDGLLLDDGENDEDEDSDEPGEGDEDEEVVAEEPADPRLALVAKGGKSSAKNLKAFHEQELAKAEKSKPKKPAGFGEKFSSEQAF